MIHVIFSLGQLISSDVQILKNKFQEALLADGKAISGDEVWKWLGAYLPKLRLNKMTLDELSIEFNTKFSLSMSAERFTECFNSMCVIDQSSLERIAALYAFLKQHPDVRVLVISHTNLSHLNYIMQQLEQVIPNCRSGILAKQGLAQPNTQLVFATSMNSQFEHHPDTLKWTINALPINLENPVFSFLNTVQKLESCKQFSYIQANSSMDATTLIDHLKKIYALDRFYNQMSALSDKADDLQKRYSQESSEGKWLKLGSAYLAASSLHTNLSAEAQTYLKASSPDACKQFQDNCKAHIETARKELSKHRGWLTLLNDLLTSIVTLFKSTEEHYSFFKTASARLLDEVQVSTQLEAPSLS